MQSVEATDPRAASDADSQRSANSLHVGFWLSILLLVLLPLEWWIFPLNLRVADIALALITAYGLAEAWARHQRLRVPLALPFWLILLSSLLATLLGFAHRNSVLAIGQEVYLFVAFVVLANVLMGFPFGRLDTLLKAWSVIAVAHATATVMGMLHIGPSMFYTDPEGVALSWSGLSRGHGTFANPNAAGAYLSISLFVLLSTSWSLGLRVGIGACLLAGIYATGSLGAMLSVIVALMMLAASGLVLRRPRQAGLGWAALIGIALVLTSLVVLLLIVLFPGLSDTLSARNARVLALTLGRLPRSFGDRLGLLAYGWSVYGQHPWGTGPNTATLYIGTLHNDYVAFLFERGPLGAIGWLLTVGTTLSVAMRAAHRSSSDSRWRVLALAAGFLGCAINALTHEISHFRQVWVFMAFVFSVSYVPVGVSASDSIHPAEPKQDATEAPDSVAGAWL